MYAVRRNIYQGSDGVQVDCLSEVKGFIELKEAERVAANCNGRVVRVIKGKRPPGNQVKENQRCNRHFNHLSSTKRINDRWMFKPSIQRN